jgi:hypothetical protein
MCCGSTGIPAVKARVPDLSTCGSATVGINPHLHSWQDEHLLAVDPHPAKRGTQGATHPL